jgi:hypothetical protein
MIRVAGVVLGLWVAAYATDAGTVVAGVVEGVLVATMPEWIAAMSWWMARRLGTGYVTLIDASGVTRRGEVSTWSVSWAGISRARWSRKYWILRAGRNLVVLPHAEFSEDEVARFHRYLADAGLI